MEFAERGSQRWLQIAVERHPEVLYRALREPLGLADDVVTVDHGTEFASQRARIARGVQLDFIRLGKPVENGLIESFSGRLRDECPNVTELLRSSTPAPRGTLGIRISFGQSAA